MQNVSTAWKENQKSLLTTEAFVKLVYRVGDDEAQQEANAAAVTGAENFADTASITNGLEKAPVKYATCEGNWTLDGSVSILPSAGNIGFVSDTLADENGYFAVNPQIKLTFAQLHTNPLMGLTVQWATAYGECAADFTITAYAGATIVAQKSVTGNTDTINAVEVEIENYDSVVIEVQRWSRGGSRARVEDIYLGIQVTYGKGELLSYTDKAECDPISTGMYNREVVFDLDNVDGKWSPDNPVGVTQYLLEQQELTAYYGYKLAGGTEWVDGATVWLAEWNTPQNGIKATFTARGLQQFMGAKYAGTLNGTLYEIAEAAFRQANLPLNRDGSTRWHIDEALLDYSVDITDDYDRTIAETLQLVANAACCVYYEDRKGQAHIERHAPSLSDYRIDRFVSYSWGEYELLAPLLYVDVNDGLYVTAAAKKGEAVEVDNPFIQTATHAEEVALWMADWLSHRKSLSGEYRADPRLDLLDGISLQNKYGLQPLLVTSTEFTFAGAFKGKYTGRVYADILAHHAIPLNTAYLGGDRL